MPFTLVRVGPPAGRLSGCSGPALAASARLFGFLPPSPIGGRERCIQELPAAAHWPHSGPDQNRLLILDINAADHGPRRAIRAPKHTPYMTLPPCVSHGCHGQTETRRPSAFPPLPPLDEMTIALAERKFSRYGEPKREKTTKAGARPKPKKPPGRASKVTRGWVF
jgi:hypothetical protein